MISINVPSYLTPIACLTEPVQVVSAPTVKTTDDGEVKANENFPGQTPFRVGVEIVTGMKTKVMPDGSKFEFPDTETLNVTVWSAGDIHAAVGEYVQLIEPLVGAFNGSIYVQALGLEPITVNEKEDGDLVDENEKEDDDTEDFDY